MRIAGPCVLVVSALLIGTGRPVRTDPFTGMPFARIDAGSLLMGTPPSEPQREAQEVQHRVTIARPFYLGIHEVTQGEWTKVMGSNPSHFQTCGAACPVENVSYLDVLAFIRALDARTSWKGFRLPTEAEWEYACRAGGTKAFGASDALTTADANFDGDYPYAGAPKGLNPALPLPVGSFRPNAWGLFDMSGNVWEWTSDDYAPYPGATAPDSPAFISGRKIIRGGSWLFGADSARCGLKAWTRFLPE